MRIAIYILVLGICMPFCVLQNVAHNILFGGDVWYGPIFREHRVVATGVDIYATGWAWILLGAVEVVVFGSTLKFLLGSPNKPEILDDDTI